MPNSYGYVFKYYIEGDYYHGSFLKLGNLGIFTSNSERNLIHDAQMALRDYYDNTPKKFRLNPERPEIELKKGFTSEVLLLPMRKDHINRKK